MGEGLGVCGNVNMPAPIVDWRSKLEIERKVIASTRTAKELVKNGFPIVDIKPHKNDGRRTVFVFNNTSELVKFISDNKLEV